MEATWKLGNVCERDLQVVTKVGELVDFKAGNDCLNDDRVALLVNLIDDLVLTLQVDGAAHEDERSVQGILVAAIRR